MYDLTRQAFYRWQEREGIRQREEEFIIAVVHQIRRRLHTCGGRNLWRQVQRFLRIFGCRPIGRDRFFNLIRRASLWVRYPKYPKIKTTYSDHHYAVEPNRFIDLELTGPGQAFVADITYIKLESNSAYLFLVTDAFTRMIVGHYLSDSLKHAGAEMALKRAQNLLGKRFLEGVVHHSDRGSQYCCHEFMDCLKELKMLGSMTDSSHCAQNALAERVNGMLKREYGCALGYLNLQQARKGIEQAIELYNYYAIHGSLNGKTPAEVQFPNDDTITRWALSVLTELPELPTKIAA